MRRALLVAGLLLVGFGLNVPSALGDLTITGATIWVITDLESWSDSSTVSSQDVIETQPGNKIHLKTVTDDMTAQLFTSGSCYVTVTNNGGAGVDLDCFVPGVRVYYAAEGSTAVSGVLTPAALAAYDEILLSNSNAHVNYTHQVKRSDGTFYVNHGPDQRNIPSLYEDSGLPITYGCTGGQYINGTMKIETPDGWSRTDARVLTGPC